MAVKKASLKQIALKANVDVSTVSRALSGSLRVKKETREEILEIAREMNYKPNELARGLVMGKTHTVGVVLPEISNAFYTSVIMSIEKVLGAAGYSLLLGLSHYNEERVKYCVDLLLGKAVDGIILMDAYDSVVEDGRDMDAPLVLVDFGDEVSTQRVDMVNSNHIVGVRLALDHLLALHHKRIAFITDNVTTSARLTEFLAYTAQAKLDCRNYVISSSVKYEEGGYQGIRNLFTRKPTPTAVFCANDYMALGAIKALGELGKRIPEDVSVVGFDDSTMLNYLRDALTTVRQQKHLLGEEAARLLLRRMESGQMGEAQRIELLPELVVRGSTAICAES